jgi:hypothetical protein
MKQFKPLIASLVVIAVALGAIALWAPGGKPAANTNTPDPPPANLPDTGLKYESLPLEKLPELDPLGLWPRDGYRLAGPEFWIMWETNEHVSCRLLATQDRKTWYNIGRSAGTQHSMSMNLGLWDSKVIFAVEFETKGTRYRSKARTVSYGAGASFAQRRYKFTLSGENVQTWDLEIVGRDARALGDEAFLTSHFPENLVTFVMPERPSIDTVKFGIQGPGAITGGGCVGFLEVYDAATSTYDRVLIELTK